MAEVKFEHVTKRYTEQVNVIQDLNLQVCDHEFLVLVGPSGCGKSTADGREVIVGIRPEHLQLAGDSQPDTLSGRVDVVEHLGNEQLVYLKIASAIVPEAAETQGSVARVSSTAQVQIGQTLRLAVDSSRLHVFDPATTNRFI